MGKGSSKGHTPREAKDNLKSTQLLSVIDAISEGPVEGPVDGLKSVLLNSTPVLDREGNTNISGVTVVFRAGEQEQTPPEGFESSGSETVLGTEVKYDTPITRTITSANIDRLRFTFGVQALVETTSKGDRNPSEVRLLVQIQRNGGWVTEKDITIKGKTTSQYLASVVVGNLPPRPFNIRMRRMTPDSTTDQLQNKTLWSSYTEIIDVKQCYPNTALVGVQVDSEQFGSQQVSRNYHLRGRILQVPSNYNPQTRQYSGIWDGTFKPAYSNNMAWCLWDMLTHPRYGMGKRLGAADVDKWALYVIGQYCDQSVPDGFGGTEPRITCNAYLTTQRKAWDVLSDFCSAMRCMPVWNGQTLTFVQDRPSDKVWTYNRSNVVMPDDGAPFRYSFSALKDRHNAVEVNWIDPNNGWETATELVEDTQAIARYGRNVTKMDAFGCTSRGQAHRAGLWLIKTELLETQTVDFSVGAEGLRHVPGDVIEICDDDYAGNPKTVAQYQLTKNFDVIWLFSEDGRNWYEEVSNFQKDTIKMAYDENNIIVAITRDASTLNPAGLSVVEVADITANRRADDSGQWMYLDGQVRKREYSSEEVNRQTEQRKATLLSEADTIIRLLERSVRLSMATEEERTRLSAWERYSVLLSRVDSANPEWPQKPEQ
ncbi:host specificity protein J [Escherichia coli]|nr:host specificity protein J [Escherichia coli]